MKTCIIHVIINQKLFRKWLTRSILHSLKERWKRIWQIPYCDSWSNHDSGVRDNQQSSKSGTDASGDILWNEQQSGRRGWSSCPQSYSGITCMKTSTDIRLNIPGPNQSVTKYRCLQSKSMFTMHIRVTVRSVCIASYENGYKYNVGGVSTYWGRSTVHQSTDANWSHHLKCAGGVELRSGLKHGPMKWGE